MKRQYVVYLCTFHFGSPNKGTDIDMWIGERRPDKETVFERHARRYGSKREAKRALSFIRKRTGEAFPGAKVEEVER